MEEAGTSLNSKLKKLSKKQSECTIYRVHKHLKDVSPSAYEPQVISIGPYNRGKDHLKMMENHKLRNLRSLVARRGLKADTYASAVSGVAWKARKCYADQDFSLSESEFIEMLVLDGCFIIQLVRKFYDRRLRDENDYPIFQMSWMLISLQRDLMLFENQVPFFVLCKLFDKIKENDDKTLLQLITNFFKNLNTGKGHWGELLQLRVDLEIKHILDLIHRNCVFHRYQQLKEVMMESMPEHERKVSEVIIVDMFLDKTEVEMDSGMALQEIEEEFKLDMLLDETLQEIEEIEAGMQGRSQAPTDRRGKNYLPLCFEKNWWGKIKKLFNILFNCTCGSASWMDSGRAPQETEGTEAGMDSGRAPQETKRTKVGMGSGMPGPEMLFINCATDLTEANVKFKKVERDTLFNIDFKDGVIKIPHLHIVDDTEYFLRNLIMYEQYFRHQLPYTVVTDYIILLDNLINSAKDVEILSHNKIITNLQGDDEVVAKMVNRLGDFVVHDTNFSYATMFGEVNEHCERRRNRWMAKLRRDYLNSPWAIISILAAVVLLLLTVAQTSLSVLQVV